MTRRILRFGIVTLLAVAFIALPAAAQEYRGQINGKVVDPSGAVVPGAQITLTHVASNTSSSVLANDIRNFPWQFPGLRAQPLNLWDLSMIKNFSITEDLKFQMPTNSNFGRSTQQDNLPRNIQIGLKLLF